MTYDLITTPLSALCAGATTTNGSKMLSAGIIIAALLGLVTRWVLPLTLTMHVVLIAL